MAEKNQTLTKGWFFGKFTGKKTNSLHFIQGFHENTLRSICGSITVKKDDMGNVKELLELTDYHKKICCGSCHRIQTKES